jgi:hypothetical protein
MVQVLYYSDQSLGLQDEYRSDGVGRDFLKIDAGGSFIKTRKIDIVYKTRKLF